MHPLEQTLDKSFHGQPTQTRRRSSLDNSALSAENSFMSLGLFGDKDDYHTSSKQRRYSLNSCENKPTLFLADLGPAREKEDLDLDCHNSGHSKECRYSSRFANKMDDGTGDTQNTSLISALDLSESSMESSSGTFCDAEEGEPANRSYLQRDLGASVFWYDDSETGSDSEQPRKNLAPSFNERNERIQAALDRVRKAKDRVKPAEQE